MNRKIIIKLLDFDREIFSFLKEVGADTPIDWNIETLDWIRNSVIEAFEKMGVTLEIDDRLQSIPSSYLTREKGHPLKNLVKVLRKLSLEKYHCSFFIW